MLPNGETTEVEPDRTVIEKLRRELGDEIIGEAKEAHFLEHNMSIRDALKLYPSAVLWSMLLSTSIIMEGYDVVLLGSFYGFPAFNKKYGQLMSNGKYEVTSSWQSGLSNGAQIGEIIGLFINGIVSERYGYKKTMIVSLSFMIAFIFIPFFSQNLVTLLMGEILQGMPWGIFQTLTTAYASEVCPTALRPALTTYVNACWVIGQLLASGVLRGLLNRTDEWGYRIPFAIQWIWPAPILIGCLFAPESPWWLVRQNRPKDAIKVVKRLTSSKNTSFSAEKSVALMMHTNQLEKDMSAGTSYLDCFKGVDLRRTEIACGTWIIQNWSGSAFMNYSTYFLEQAGFSDSRAFDLSIGQYAIGLFGTFSSWILMRPFGRRSIYLGGLTIMSSLLLIIGFMGLAKSDNKGALWAIGAMLLVYTLVYDMTIGPVCYCLVTEIPSTRLRSKTIVIARNAYNLCGIVNSVVMPKMLNTDALNWGAKTGWFWGGMAILCLIWTYFRLPEPKNRTFGELDILFEQGVAARKFSSTHVDQFGEGHHGSGGASVAEKTEKPASLNEIERV